MALGSENGDQHRLILCGETSREDVGRGHGFGIPLRDSRTRGGECVLTTNKVPSETSADLRGVRLPMLKPAPWPAVAGCPLLLVIEIPDRIKIRETSQVVRMSGPVPGAEA